MYVEHTRKLYTDDTSRLSVCSFRGNQYIIIAYNCDSNVTLQAPFKTKEENHRVASYSSITRRLKACGHSADLQILDNKDSAEYGRIINEEWHVKLQLVPLDIHCRNAAKRAFQMFKAHFLSILAGVNHTFPRYLWDPLLDQTELNLNLLLQATLYPSISAWDYFNAPHSYDATPLVTHSRSTHVL